MEARIDGVATGGRAERNAWVIGDNQEVIVVDPGENAGAVLGVAGDREILPVVCTHGHAAHAGAALEGAERDEAPVALHPRDRLFVPEVAGRSLAHAAKDAGRAYPDARRAP